MSNVVSIDRHFVQRVVERFPVNIDCVRNKSKSKMRNFPQFSLATLMRYRVGRIGFGKVTSWNIIGEESVFALTLRRLSFLKRLASIIFTEGSITKIFTRS